MHVPITTFIYTYLHLYTFIYINIHLFTFIYIFHFHWEAYSLPKYTIIIIHNHTKMTHNGRPIFIELDSKLRKLLKFVHIGWEEKGAISKKHWKRSYLKWALKKKLFWMSLILKIIINITNFLFQKFNYKSETYLIKITYQKQDYSFYCCQLKFWENKMTPKIAPLGRSFQIAPSSALISNSSFFSASWK